MTRKGVIGRGGMLPWKLSSDLKRFKSLTMGHHLLMGRKTFDSLGRVLPGRTSIVISRQAECQAPPEVLVVHDLEEAIRLASSDDEVFIIGGAEIFCLALNRANRMYVTWVEAEIAGDTLFPAWNPAEWQLVSSERHSADEKNEYDTTFCVYDRIST
jgi:dihydrofolate reductase